MAQSVGCPDLQKPSGKEEQRMIDSHLSINLKQFNTQKPMAVFLYQSLQDHTAIACGDIP
jgi:hypothetical protein